MNRIDNPRPRRRKGPDIDDARSLHLLDAAQLKEIDDALRYLGSLGGRLSGDQPPDLPARPWAS
jgi:hypothetical protein